MICFFFSVRCYVLRHYIHHFYFNPKFISFSCHPKKNSIFTSILNSTFSRAIVSAFKTKCDIFRSQMLPDKKQGDQMDAFKKKSPKM
jgi:hypothetical protein